MRTKNNNLRSLELFMGYYVSKFRKFIDKNGGYECRNQINRIHKHRTRVCYVRGCTLREREREMVTSEGLREGAGEEREEEEDE